MKLIDKVLETRKSGNLTIDVGSTCSGLFVYEISMEGEIIYTGSGFLTLEEAMEDALSDINNGETLTN